MAVMTWLPPGFLGLGLLLVIAALLARRSARAFEASAVRAWGTVVELREVIDTGDRSRTWAPTVEFEQGGRKVRFTSSGSASPPEFAVGQQVQVLYAPGAPHDAVIHRCGRVAGFRAVC